MGAVCPIALSPYRLFAMSPIRPLRRTSIILSSRLLFRPREALGYRLSVMRAKRAVPVVQRIERRFLFSVSMCVHWWFWCRKPILAGKFRGLEGNPVWFSTKLADYRKAMAVAERWEKAPGYIGVRR